MKNRHHTLGPQGTAIADIAAKTSKRIDAMNELRRIIQVRLETVEHFGPLRSTCPRCQLIHVDKNSLEDMRRVLEKFTGENPVMVAQEEKGKSIP